MTGEDETIALLIAVSGEEPPSWLGASVSKARGTLAWTIQKEREYPTRKELQARLKELASAIETVRKAMLDIDLATLLRAGDDFLLNENETYHGLGALAERVKNRLVELPVRKGRDKFFGRPEGATPQQNCALMVSILWERVHSAAPKADDRQAQKACAELWAAAGGLVERDGKIVGHWSGRSNPSTAVWRDHLRAAKKLDDSKETRLLRRSLDLNAARTPATPEEAELIRRLERLGGQSSP